MSEQPEPQHAQVTDEELAAASGGARVNGQSEGVDIPKDGLVWEPSAPGEAGEIE